MVSLIWLVKNKRPFYGYKHVKIGLFFKIIFQDHYSR